MPHYLAEHHRIYSSFILQQQKVWELDLQTY